MGLVLRLIMAPIVLATLLAGLLVCLVVLPFSMLSWIIWGDDED